MKRLIAVAALLTLAGCGDVTNQEIVATNKLCRENGMDVELGRELMWGALRIHCVPVEYTAHERLDILARRFPIQEKEVSP